MLTIARLVGGSAVTIVPRSSTSAALVRVCMSSSTITSPSATAARSVRNASMNGAPRAAPPLLTSPTMEVSTLGRRTRDRVDEVTCEHDRVVVTGGQAERRDAQVGTTLDPLLDQDRLAGPGRRDDEPDASGTDLVEAPLERRARDRAARQRLAERVRLRERRHLTMFPRGALPARSDHVRRRLVQGSSTRWTSMMSTCRSWSRCSAPWRAAWSTTSPTRRDRPGGAEDTSKPSRAAATTGPTVPSTVIS